MKEQNETKLIIISLFLFLSAVLLVIADWKNFSDMPLIRSIEKTFDLNRSKEKYCLKIMPLGDSITHGGTVEGGYRIELFNIFQENNFNVDFVGSQVNGPSYIDRHHEGYPGASIRSLLPKIDGALNNYKPDIVLLMIGTNNILYSHDQELPSIIEDLKLLLDKIAKHPTRPNLLIASIPELNDDSANERAEKFNSEATKIVEDYNKRRSKVYFVDMAEAISLSLKDLEDGVHPNRSGYEKIAYVWYESLEELIKHHCQGPRLLKRLPILNTTQNIYN